MRDSWTSKPPGSHRHGPVVTLAAIACAVALAACGSGAGPSSAAASGGPNPAAHADFLKFSKCMRSHGVPSFPDPSPGGGIHLNAGSGLNPQSPRFQSAQQACHKLLPGGGPPSHPTAQDEAQMLHVSQCMRRHGVSGFPDPTLSPPSSPTGYSEVVDRGGVVLAIPNTIDTASPAFKQAAAACGFAHLG
jgi:hypothetical protein